MPLADPKARAEYDMKRIRTNEPGYLQFKANRKIVYQDRKLRQVCCDCEAPLEEDDGARCKLCADRDKANKEIYRYTPKGRRAQQRSQRRYYRQRKKRKLCVQCSLPRAEWPERIYKRKTGKPPGTMICPACRTKANEAAKRFRRRRKLGIVSLASERKKRDRAKLRELRGETYQPIDVVIAKPRVRILRALRFFEWVTAVECFDSIGVPQFDEEDHAERDAYTQALSRLVRGEKLVERRNRNGAREAHEYKLTPAGHKIARGLR